MSPDSLENLMTQSELATAVARIRETADGLADAGFIDAADVFLRVEQFVAARIRIDRIGAAKELARMGGR